MGSFRRRSFAPVPFRLLFFTLFTCNLTAASTQMTNPPQGTCYLSPNDFLGFKCDCDFGWKKFNIGSFEFPSCIIPNCTFDFQCGNGSPPPPPPPPPPPSPSFNLSNPCLLNMCGDGTCETNGSEFRCQCYEGSANLLNDPKLTCFRKCALGADCKDLDLGLGSPAIQTPPAIQSLPSPPLGNSGFPGTGSGEMLNCSRELHMVTATILAAIFLKWM